MGLRRSHRVTLPAPVYGFEDLARYNADRERGVVFTPEAQDHYAEQQAEFDHLQAEAHEAAGWRREGNHWIWP